MKMLPKRDKVLTWTGMVGEMEAEKKSSLHYFD